ncbi:MAG TPA: DNA mismatch repair endonuclease MutL [Polyangiaceae bacterium]|nr:DNA mismatch repair endonuclease MutL [Polyangiaceae bacterium]
MSASRVAVLPPELASQIAAGEVVERPSSAVKELIENALDAEASRVDVEIEGGGTTLLGVTDDGVGMNEADARLSVERHATSKLRLFADLARVATFGFRGEALPTIASVSRFSLRTRPRESDVGTLVQIEGGKLLLAEPVGMATGTQLQVRDLFYNVPARRKFLRSTGTESGHVTEVVEQAALSRPDITFTLTRDGRKVRELLRASERAERVRQVCELDDLAACAGERGPLKVEAFLSRPEQARSGAGGLAILVNGRPVRDRAILVTIAQAYGSVLERGRYPRGVVYIDLAPELVDVNVHPQKSEVRFADPRAASDAVYQILSKALVSAFSLPPVSRAAWGRGPSPRVSPPAIVPLKEELPQRPSPKTEAELPMHLLMGAAARAPLAEPLAAITEAPFVAVRDHGAAPIRPRPDVPWASLRFIAQLRMTYLVCEGEDGVYLLDQHAAAERVTFTRLIRQYQARSVPAQALLFPLVIDVSQTELELVEARQREIAEVGLDVRARGTSSLSIHAVPRLLASASPERLLRDLLSEVSRSGGRGFSDAVDLALATMACHGSIRAGDALTPDEAKALLRALDDADFAGHCPHGRPVVTFLSYVELERKVGRR